MCELHGDSELREEVEGRGAGQADEGAAGREERVVQEVNNEQQVGGVHKEQ